MSQQTAQPEYLTVAQAAEIFGTSERTVRRLIAAGSLPAYRIGPRAVRVLADDVRNHATPIPATTPAHAGGAR